MIYTLVFLILLFAQSAWAVCTVGTFGGGGATPQKLYYVCDAIVDAPSTGLRIGSMLWDGNTKYFYVADTATHWQIQSVGSVISGVGSVSNIDGTLTISPTTGAVVASLNLSHSNTFTAAQAITISSGIVFTATTGVGASVFTDNSGSAFHVLSMRANAGKTVWLSFTENAVADRWSIGIKAADATLYFSTSFPTGLTDRAYLTSGGVFNVTTGFQVAGAAASGHYLRGNGTNYVDSVILAGDLPGGITGFANPTASVALAVVNGSATTAMRSDAAPPLSQSISPTWTGSHIFTLATVINMNGGTPPTIDPDGPSPGIPLKILGANGFLPSIVQQSYGSSSNLNFIRANNTLASPTTLALDDAIGGIVAQGYDGTVYSPTQAAIHFRVGQAWTATKHATNIRFLTTPIDSVTIAEAVRIAAGLMIGTTTDPGIGKINVLTGYQIANVALAASHLSNGVTGSGAIVLANTPTLITPILGVATGTSLVLSSTSSVLTVTTGGGQTIVSDASGTAFVTLNIRPSGGKTGWLSFTEDGVADRWAIGIKNADTKLYFSPSFPTSIAEVSYLTTAGNLWLAGSLLLRDTSAAYNVTLTATSSTTLTAGRILTLDMGNVAHTLKLGTTANTITFPNVASDTVAMLASANIFTVGQAVTLTGTGPAETFTVVDNSTGIANGGIFTVVNTSTTVNSRSLVTMSDGTTAGVRFAAIFTQHTPTVTANFCIQTKNAGTMLEKLCVGATGGVYTINATGGDKGIDTINATTYYGGGNAGLSQTFTVCKTGACVTTCSIITTGGIVTGGTC